MSFDSHGITKPNYSNGIITVFYRFSTYILGYAFNPIRLFTTRCGHIYLDIIIKHPNQASLFSLIVLQHRFKQDKIVIVSEHILVSFLWIT